MSNDDKSKDNLLICPSVGVWKVGDNLWFDRKFYDGMLVYANLWHGQIRVVMRVDSSPPPKFGLSVYDPTTAPFKVSFLSEDESISNDHINGADIVLASADDYRQTHLSKLCAASKIKCIYIIEYTIRTRIQISLLTNASLLKKTKSIIWLILQEFKLRNALKFSYGIQANGTAAYSTYSQFVPSPILYFDTRNTTEMLVTSNELETRLTYLDNNAPLRLTFSGRLTGMKGADDLVLLAVELQSRNVPFKFDIFGDGDLFEFMQDKINAHELGSQVILHGAVDFEKELVPYIKSSVDVFICCHKQGDPSCTYMETYACGVPILGYSNEAHSGILKIADVGWSSPMGNVQKLASTIQFLSKNRNEIKIKSRATLDLALKHTFEETFLERIKHLKNAIK